MDNLVDRVCKALHKATVLDQTPEALYLNADDYLAFNFLLVDNIPFVIEPAAVGDTLMGVPVKKARPGQASQLRVSPEGGHLV